MEIKLRQETPSDHQAIAEVIVDTYRDVWYSNHKEQEMVERLRRSKAFVPQLSIVAQDENGELAGHILFTEITIQNNGQSHTALALAPLSVKPAYQNKGIGGKLVTEGHRVAKELGYRFIVILGIPGYYQKLGYEFLSKYDIRVPIKISDQNCFIISLTGEGLSEIIGGAIRYPDEFFG